MAVPSTKARIEVDGQIIDEVERFDYSSNVLAIGDESHVTVTNQDRRYTAALKVGSRSKISLSNPAVKNGAWILKHAGRITRRSHAISQQGSSLTLTCADLGWHLQNCCAPLWYNLRKARYPDLFDPSVFQRNRRGRRYYFLDPSFGLTGVRFDNNINRRLKQGTREVAASQQRDFDPVFAIQAEPGDLIIDKMTEYARRYNLLVNVSVDGKVQAFLPNYAAAPEYRIRNLSGADSAANNVIAAQMDEDARTLWTTVECVGEQVGTDLAPNADNPNATKKRGSVYHKELVPYEHRLTFSDSEMFREDLAQKAAEWKYKRGLYDSWFVDYTVSDHHQGGKWWEADAMCDVQDDELGLFGVFYIESVQCTADRENGDTTHVVLRKPGLLTASFGVYPNPPIVSSSDPERGANGKTTTTDPAT